MIDEPIRKTCERMNVTYSTWIDDLAFSGERARELIQPTASALAIHGIRIKRAKIKIMGPSTIKLLTGTRLGIRKVRAPKDKLSRIRSGIHKLCRGLVKTVDEERYINNLAGQLKFIKHISPLDFASHIGALKAATKGRALTTSTRKLLAG
jgi:hypothetical protein